VEISANEKSLTVYIINNGPTLTPSEQENLFDYFFRGQNSRNKIGIGLGLVMVAKIARLHEGEVSYSIAATGQNSFCLKLNRA